MSGEVIDPKNEGPAQEAPHAGNMERYEFHKDHGESFLPDPEGVITQGELLELSDGEYVFMGIDASGAAIVRKKNGSERTFDEGEVDIEALRNAKRSHAAEALDEGAATSEAESPSTTSLESLPELESELAQRVEQDARFRALLHEPHLSLDRRERAEAVVASNERRFREIADALGIADADPDTIFAYIREERSRQRHDAAKITPEDESERDPKAPPTHMEVERAKVEEMIREHQGDAIPKWLLRKHKDSPYVREHVIESARAAMLSGDDGTLVGLEEWERRIASEQPIIGKYLKRLENIEGENRPPQTPAWQKLKEQSELAAMRRNEGHDDPAGRRVIATLREDLRNAGLDEERIQTAIEKQLKKHRRRFLHTSDIVDIRRVVLGGVGTKEISETRPDGAPLELSIDAPSHASGADEEIALASHREEDETVAERSDEVDLASLGDRIGFIGAADDSESFAEWELAPLEDENRQAAGFSSHAANHREGFDPLVKYWDDFSSPVIEDLERAGKLDLTYDRQEHELDAEGEAMRYFIEHELLPISSVPIARDLASHVVSEATEVREPQDELHTETPIQESIGRGFEAAFKGIDIAMLERIPGFRTLSEGQHRLALEKLRAASLEDIEKEQIVRYRRQIDELAANPSDGRIARFGKLLKRGWKGFTKKWEFGRIKDEAKNEWENAEDFDNLKMKEETLAAIVDGIRTTESFGLDTEGKSIVFVDAKDMPDANERTMLKVAEFNALANAYANSRYGEENAVESEELRVRFASAAKEMTALLAKEGGRSVRGEQGAAAWRVRLESTIATERFAKGREEVLEEYAKSGRNIGAAVGFRDLLLSRGSFAAVTAGARYLGLAAVGLSALPVVAAASAGTMSTFRSIERNRENDLLARLGERDTTDDSSYGSDRSRIDNRKERSKNVVSGASLVTKLDSTLRQFNEASTTELRTVSVRDREGRIVINPRTGKPKQEQVSAREAAKRDLEARLAYTTRKLEEELVDLGKEPGERAEARAHIALALAKARAEVDFADPSVRNATVVRLRSILDIREKKIERNRLKSIVIDGAKAAVVGYALSWGARYVAGMLPGARAEGSMKLPWGERKSPSLANVPLRHDVAHPASAASVAVAPEAHASAASTAVKTFESPASAASAVEKVVEKTKEIKDTLISGTDAAKLAKRFVEDDLAHSPSKEIAQSWSLLHDRDVSAIFAETKESAMARPGGADEWASVVRIREYLKAQGLLKEMIAPKRGETLEAYVLRVQEDRLIHLGKTAAASVEQPASAAKTEGIVSPKAPPAPETAILPERKLSELSPADRANWPADKPSPWPTNAAEAEGLYGSVGSKTRVLAEEIKKSVGRYPNEEEFLAYRRVESDPVAARSMLAAMKRGPLSFSDTRKSVLGVDVPKEASRPESPASSPKDNETPVYRPTPFRPRQVSPAVEGDAPRTPSSGASGAVPEAAPKVIYQPKPFVPRTLDQAGPGRFSPTSADTMDAPPRMTNTSSIAQEGTPRLTSDVAQGPVRAPYQGMEADVDRALDAQKQVFRSMYGGDANKTPHELIAKYGNDNAFAKQVTEYAKKGLVPKEGESAVDFIARAYKESLLLTKVPPSEATSQAATGTSERMAATKEGGTPSVSRVVAEGRYRDPLFVKEISDAWKEAAERGVTENPHWREIAARSPREVVVAIYPERSPGSLGAANAEMVAELKKAYQTGFVPHARESCKDFLSRVGEEIGSGKPSQERIGNLWNALIGNERLDAFPRARSHATELLSGKNPTGIDQQLFFAMRARMEKLARLSGILPDDPRESVDEYAQRAIRVLLTKNPLLSLRTLDLMPPAAGLGKEA